MGSPGQGRPSRRRPLRRWLPSLGLLTFIIVFMVLAVWVGEVGSLFWAFVLLPACWVLSPWFFPRPGTRAEALSQPDRVAIYFKPADAFSIWLRISLRNWVRRAIWVDILRDPEADAFVRSINRDLDIVPTVIAGADTKRNPEAIWVLRRINRLAKSAQARENGQSPTDEENPDSSGGPSA